METISDMTDEELDAALRDPTPEQLEDAADEFFEGVVLAAPTGWQQQPAPDDEND